MYYLHFLTHIRPPKLSLDIVEEQVERRGLGAAHVSKRTNLREIKRYRERHRLAEEKKARMKHYQRGYWDVEKRLRNLEKTQLVQEKKKF